MGFSMSTKQQSIYESENYLTGKKSKPKAGRRYCNQCHEQLHGAI